MLAPDGTLKVLEYNCRLGDPETQVILPRLKSDFAGLCLAAINGELERQSLDWDNRQALTVVLANQGYPSDYPKGDIIEGLNTNFDSSIKIFHAGTSFNNHHIAASGGRVLAVTALGDDIKTAQSRAYSACEKITWPHKYHRGDIGARALPNMLKALVERKNPALHRWLVRFLFANIIFSFFIGLPYLTTSFPTQILFVTKTGLAMVWGFITISYLGQLALLMSLLALLPLLLIRLFTFWPRLFSYVYHRLI